VAVVIPLLGIGYVLTRLVTRTATGTWRRTEGRPLRRALAVVLAAALVAGLGWTWWPDGDRYRPVRAWEGGTVLDAVPAADSRSLGTGSRGAAATIWPQDAGPLPTADRPALAMVLVPASGVAAAEGGASGSGDTDAAPTWVFPFDRPSPPEDGDNQALAVNTEDGSVRYDVSFALVWANEDAVLNRNEAYALASCRDCRTVAVAFQVVLVVGSVDVVVPQNLSAAVNYACIECVTYALATQLVVSVPGPLGAAGTQELAAIWAELQAFGERIEGVPLAELRSRLTEFEQRILTVVREDAAEAPEDGDAGPADSADADPADDGSSAGGSATSTRSSAPGGAGSTGSPAGPTTGAATPSGGSPASTSQSAAPTSAQAGTTAATTSASPTG
jgi:putative peptide zinc metalloprotease protein